MPGAARLVKILTGIAISAVLLAYLFWNVDLRAVTTRLADTQWSWLALSMALNLASLWARAARWRYLFPPSSHPKRLFNAVIIGYMGNNVLPLRAGEVLRVYVAARHGPRVWTTVATLVVERALDGLAVGVLLAFVFSVVPVPREMAWAAQVFGAFVVCLLVALVIIAAAPLPCRIVIHSLSYRWPAVERRLIQAFDVMSEGLQAMRRPRQLLPVAFWSAVIWFVIVLTVWAGFRAAHLDLPLLAGCAVIAFVGLGVSLPSSPGFVGVVQAATVLALALFDVAKADALSFSLLLHASQFVPVTIWGLALLVVEHVSLTAGARRPDLSAGAQQD